MIILSSPPGVEIRLVTYRYGQYVVAGYKPANKICRAGKEELGELAGARSALSPLFMLGFSKL